MSFQFAHLETYSRKPNKQGVSTKFVFDEVTRREPDACRHVENPQPPELVYGMPVEDLEALHDSLCAETKMINCKGQSRGLRKDQHTLMTLVLSYPDNPEPGVASYEEWERRNIEWAEKKYGAALKTVVRHTDEAKKHVHVYVIPEGMKAKDLNPGYVAKIEAQASASLESPKVFVSEEARKEDAKRIVRAGNRAYRESMREWQDDYYESVGRPCGLTRIGPARRRLTREEHKIEKEQEKRNREAVLMREEAARRDTISREKAKDVSRKVKILNEEVGDGWFSSREKAKKIAKLTADDILKEERLKGRDDALREQAPKFQKLKKAAQEKLDAEREKAKSLVEQNALLTAENRNFSALSHGYEMRMAQMEMVMTETVHGLRDVAYETGSEKAYGKLSSACQHVSETHEADRNVFAGLISDVREICAQVKQHVPQVFRKFFGWTPEQKAEQEARQREVDRMKEQTRRRDNTRQSAAPSSRPQSHSP